MSRSGASFFAGSARNCGHAGYPRDPRPPRATRTPEEQAYDASSVMKRLHYGNCPCTSRPCSFTRSSRTGISLYEQFAALQGETTLLDIFWNFNTATSVCVIDARTISFIFFFFFFFLVSVSSRRYDGSRTTCRDKKRRRRLEKIGSRFLVSFCR